MLVPAVCLYATLSLVRILGGEEEVKLTCHSVCFLLTEGLNLVISVVFLGIGWTIEQNTKLALAERLRQALNDVSETVENETY